MMTHAVTPSSEIKGWWRIRVYQNGFVVCDLHQGGTRREAYIAARRLEAELEYEEVKV